MTDRSSFEPRRWSDASSDAPAPLRPALQEARNLTVDHARVMRLAERVGVQTGVAAGVGLSSVAPPASVAAFKLWAYLSGAVAVSGAALVIWTQWAPSEPVLAIANLASAAPQALTVEPAEPAENSSAQVAPSGTLGTLAGASQAIEPAIALQRSDGSAAAPRAFARRRVQASPVLAASVVAPRKLDPQAELSILNRAQDALAQAPRRALTLATEHAQDFPQGVFAQEREVIAIEALLKLQRTGDATARGQAFLTTFAGSTHAPRVRQMLEQPR